jgi:hypothetical protein
MHRQDKRRMWQSILTSGSQHHGGREHRASANPAVTVPMKPASTKNAIRDFHGRGLVR